MYFEKKKFQACFAKFSNLWAPMTRINAFPRCWDSNWGPELDILPTLMRVYSAWSKVHDKYDLSRQ